MNCQAVFIYSDQFTKYTFHSDHPFNQVRVRMTKELLEATGKLHSSHLVEPRIATDAEIELVHDKQYIEAVKKASIGLLAEDEGLEFGLGTEDTPIFQDMHRASSLLVGATLTAVDHVLTGNIQHALNLGGGLHHGFRDKASGFCIYNDGAIAIKYIRKKYNLRVLYVDTDAHHGDGVQSVFYDDPNVCTLSIHETGRYLFPGTGNSNERGIKEGYGYSFNVPIDAFTEDESFLHVYEIAFKEVIEYFQPDIIITQNGVDAHSYDPLTHLNTTMNVFEKIPLLAHKLAHQYCKGKWIALGGGGYDIWRVVPRAWGQLWAVMTGSTPFKDQLPKSWLTKWQKVAPIQIPHSWQDPTGIYHPIPRKLEITEKNALNLEKTLQIIKNQRKFGTDY
ncbi:acetoin utilization protein AcuC [Aquibacillus albus]|uniref:Acetoin utilization protein AcuC n=1 Tax=Aquibacillus albus TaxID=1168171 RepID=A0ABS2N3X8_9BACI|nr:acetoin utilization protein AcuC [Aquibacillus albus]MBM7572844.1 acetoin utilization protein AcuC [Aquibacillus albus]